MSYLVLYRKHRPKTFKEILGQEIVIKILTNALKENRISHAYLFSGPHGVGKTTTARLLAKALNCQNRGEGEVEPCNKCDSCLEINQGSSIDLIEIDAASNRGIDEIRALKQGVNFTPVKSKYKVFIIDEAHQLTGAAANAILKTLEEPPSHAVFILATTEAHKMLPTILSRCQRLNFRKLKLQEIIQRLTSILKKEGVAFEESILPIIAWQARGALRDAESLLEQIISFTGPKETIRKETVIDLLGLTEKTIVFKFLKLIVEKKSKEAIELLNDLLFQGTDLKEFTSTLIQFSRQILFLKLNSHLQSPLFLTLTDKEKQFLFSLVKRLSQQQIKRIINVLSEAEKELKYSEIPQLPLELAVLELSDTGNSKSL